MVKYQIEGDIDFYQELFHSLNDKELNLEEKNEDDICLITNNTLTENFIKLDCGHTFNYLPLYKDIMNHKNKFNSMETKDSILKITQIRCPYCRTIHNKLIPYIEMEGVEKKHGVNFFDIDYEKYLHKFTGVCCYECINVLFDESKEEDDITNPKIMKCDNDEVIKIKENNKDYCFYHKCIFQKQFQKDKIVKEKQVIKEAKILAKLEAKKQKIAEKLLLKTAKLEKIKTEKINNFDNMTKDNLEENFIIQVFCNAILKTGKNIGCQCGPKRMQ